MKMNNNNLSQEINQLHARICSAISDPHRILLLYAIAEKTRNVNGLAETVGISQSAASRHLKQLSATGYLAERRCSGAKCYRLDPKRVEDTLQAVSRFLLNSK